MWIIFGLLLLWNAATFLIPATGSSVSLAYSDFLAQVRAGSVATVTFNGQNVDGTFAGPVPRAGRSAAGPAGEASRSRPILDVGGAIDVGHVPVPRWHF